MTSNSDINQGSAATTNGSGEVPFQGWEIRQTLIARMRDRYATVFDEEMSRCIDDLAIPQDQQQMVVDAALFTVFAASIKHAAIGGRAPKDRRALAISYFEIERRIKNEVMLMLNEFVDEEKAGG